MAQVNYKNYKYNGNQKRDYKVTFFPTLADGQEIFVRFPYSKDETFHTATTHTIKVNGIFRQISCLEDGCPLCAKEKAKTNLFLKVLVYQTEGDSVVTKAHVWSRPYLFGQEIEEALKNAIEYELVPSDAAIEDVVFKLKRVGTGKSTKYSVSPAKSMYQTSELYGKKFDDFKDLRINGVYYMEKTADEINSYLANGTFPAKKSSMTQSEPKAEVKKKEAPAPVKQEPAPAPQPVASAPVAPAPQPQSVVETKPIEAPIAQSQSEEKPKRKYSFR